MRWTGDVVSLLCLGLDALGLCLGVEGSTHSTQLRRASGIWDDRPQACGDGLTPHSAAANLLHRNMSRVASIVTWRLSPSSGVRGRLWVEPGLSAAQNKDLGSVAQGL